MGVILPRDAMERLAQAGPTSLDDRKNWRVMKDLPWRPGTLWTGAARNSSINEGSES